MNCVVQGRYEDKMNIHGLVVGYEGVGRKRKFLIRWSNGEEIAEPANHIWKTRILSSNEDVNEELAPIYEGSDDDLSSVGSEEPINEFMLLDILVMNN